MHRPPLLHVSICVGPSWGQMFFMWLKSLFGGRLHSYMQCWILGEEVLMRLNQQANELGCASIVNIRIETSVISFAKNRKANNPRLNSWPLPRYSPVIAALIPTHLEPLLAFLATSSIVPRRFQISSGSMFNSGWSSSKNPRESISEKTVKVLLVEASNRNTPRR